MTSRIKQLDAIVEQFNLNEHPFYQAWRAGTLPVEQLADYAAEWAPFIAVIDRGWERIGEPAYAAEEREHDELWTTFRTSLGHGALGEMRRPQSRILLSIGENAFESIPETLGALYSFEVQQPATAQSKLAGLQEHYAGTVSEDGQAYFREHAVETDEPAMLAARIEGLSDEEFSRAVAGCTLLSAAAWSALDGVYYAEA